MEASLLKRFEFLNILKLNIVLIVLILILFCGAFLRLKGLNFQSLWFDEICSVTRANPDLTLNQIYNNYQIDPHPPFHPIILHYWMKLFGYNEFSPRLLSSLFGILGIFILYLLGREVAGKQAGLISAAITAFNYYHLTYSQEVRPYVFAFLFSALSFLFFIRLVKTQTRKNMILYSLSSVFLIYTHYYGLIMLLSQYIALIIYVFTIRSDIRRKLLTHFSFSGILISILYSPWIPTVIKMLKKKDHFTKKPAPDFFILYFKTYFGNNSYLTIISAVIILCLLIFLFLRSNGFQFKAVSLKKPELTIPLFFCVIFFSLYIPYMRSIWTFPFLHHKYTITTFALIIPLIAAGISLFRENFLKYFIIITIILVSIFNIIGERAYYKKVSKRQWRAVSKHVLRLRSKNRPCIYFAKKKDHYQFYFDLYKSGIKILPSEIELLNLIFLQKKPVNICILVSHGGLPKKSFMNIIYKNYTLSKKKKCYGAEALYFRLKNYN